jgi:hypothetical protein
MRRLTHSAQRALKSAAMAALAGPIDGTGDLSAKDGRYLPKAVEWLDEIPKGGHAVIFTREQARALLDAANLGLDDLSNKRSATTARKAMIRIVEAFGGRWESRAGHIVTDI